MTDLWPEHEDVGLQFCSCASCVNEEVHAEDGREVRLREFFGGIRAKLDRSAQGKGYALEGGDGTPLYDFVRHHVAGGTDAHAMGEMIYKVVEAAGRPELRANLMLKVAAWAFLVWDAEQREKA